MLYVGMDGESVPALGFGTFQLEGDACYDGVADALDLGYRHLDTAAAYGNEQEVGKALAASGLDRGEVFVTTKVWWEDLTPDGVRTQARHSLERLRLDHVDLLLIHWPAEETPLEETLAALDELRSQGRTRHVGVSNFPPALLRRALESSPVACEQVEYHPYLAQPDLLAIAQDNELALTAYSPLARGRVLEDPTLTEIGRAHGKGPAQVTLRWLLQQPGVAAIPKASSSAHRRTNLEVFDFELDRDEMDQIHALARGQRLIDPPWAPDWGDGRERDG